MTLPLTLVLAHFLGDFVLQTDEMAIKKSKEYRWLALHVAVYALCFIPWGFRFWLVTLIAHFITDAVTSRITSRLWFFRQESGIWAQAPNTVPYHDRQIVNPWTPIDGKRHWFFVMIGFDQVLHYAQLALTLWWVSR